MNLYRVPVTDASVPYAQGTTWRIIYVHSGSLANAFSKVCERMGPWIYYGTAEQVDHAEPGAVVWE